MRALIVPAVEAFRRDPKQYQALKALLDGINEERAALGAGTYTENPQYGKWGTVWVASHQMRDGFTGPVWGSTPAGYLPGFLAGSELDSSIEVPAEYDGGPLGVKLFFTFATAPTPGDTRTWALVSQVAHPGGAITGTTILAADYACRAGDDESTCSVRMPFPDLGLRSGAIILFRVIRSEGATPDPYLIGVSWAYRKQRFGLEDRP